MLTEQDFRVDTDVHLRFASVHLLARSLSDLLAGGHLASHYYLPQAHSVLRPVIDSCDLMDLFAGHPDQAEKWVTTDRPWVDFAPATVRKLLGREKLDPVHSYFSEAGSHPRFEGARISGGLVINPEDPTDQTALFQVGPIWPEHPATLLIWPSFSCWPPTPRSVVHTSFRWSTASARPRSCSGYVPSSTASKRAMMGPSWR